MYVTRLVLKILATAQLLSTKISVMVELSAF